jgi:protein involved in polysaccharide export with SLBB domain
MDIDEKKEGLIVNVKLITIIIFMSVAACAPTSKITTAPASLQNEMAPSVPKVVLGPGDVIDVKFRFTPELDYQQTIRPDGKITLQMVDEVTVAGLTPEELDKHLTQLFSTKLKSPEITVFVVSLANQMIYVTGQVNRPAAYNLEPGTTVIKAITMAGGFTGLAAQNKVKIIRKVNDKEQVLENVSLHEKLMPEDVMVVPESFF